MKNILLEKAPGRMFHSISSKLLKRLEKEGKKYGLTTAHQFGILLILSDDSMSQKEIANKAFSDEPTITRTLDRMIKNNLIVKKRSNEDKRKQIVKITEKGKELLDNIFPIVLNVNKEIRDILEEDEFNQLINTLQKIDSHL